MLLIISKSNKDKNLICNGIVFKKEKIGCDNYLFKICINN